MDSGSYETVWKARENQAENWYWNLVPRPISTLCSPDICTVEPQLCVLNQWMWLNDWIHNRHPIAQSEFKVRFILYLKVTASLYPILCYIFCSIKQPDSMHVKPLILASHGAPSELYICTVEGQHCVTKGTWCCSTKQSNHCQPRLNITGQHPRGSLCST